jgi:hypothetical protein
MLCIDFEIKNMPKKKEKRKHENMSKISEKKVHSKPNKDHCSTMSFLLRFLHSKIIKCQRSGY